MTLIGIFNSRLGIGVEIFTNNLIYGPIAYLFLGLSGIFIIGLLQISKNPSYNGKYSRKRAVILIGVLYLIGFILTIINVIENMIIYRLNIVIILFTVFIGIFWSTLGYYGYKYKRRIPMVCILIVTFIFSLGITYGVFLNTSIIPSHIYYLFISISLLQLSRELTKGLNEKEKNINYFPHNDRLIGKSFLKFPLIFQILSIVLLILPLFSDFNFSALLVFLYIFSIIIIGLATFLTLASIIEKNIYKKISKLLKIGILLELLLLLIFGN